MYRTVCSVREGSRAGSPPRRSRPSETSNRHREQRVKPRIIRDTYMYIPIYRTIYSVGEAPSAGSPPRRNRPTVTSTQVENRNISP